MFDIRNTVYLVLCSSCFIYVTANSIITNEAFPGSGKVVELRKPFTLECNSTSRDPLSNVIYVIWSKDGILINDTEDRITISSGGMKLVVKRARLEDAGIYECADENLKATIKVSVQTEIEQFPKSLNLVQGDTLRLQCKAVGSPLPKITWYKDNELLNTTEERIELEPNDKNLTDAMLIIKDLDYHDRADYMCVAENECCNPVNATVLVRIKDKLAALWPFLGICAEVAILCAIIFIYEKKRVKPDFDESDTDQIPESKNVADKDKVPDVRQRK